MTCNIVQEETHVATIWNSGSGRCIDSGHCDARAQGQTGNTVPDERPATTTIMGDTGLWFVPAGEVLKDKQLVCERVSHQLGRGAGVH